MRRGVAEAHALLDTAYRWLNDTMKGREWAAGDAFSLADCAAAPALFYADWVHPIDASLSDLRAYRRTFACKTVVCTRRGRSATLPCELSARSAGP